VKKRKVGTLIYTEKNADGGLKSGKRKKKVKLFNFG
jgi:hypothetical protein